MLYMFLCYVCFVSCIFRSDVMVSAAVFCGLAGAHAGYPILDPAVAVLVAGIIIKQVS